MIKAVKFIILGTSILLFSGCFFFGGDTGTLRCRFTIVEDYIRADVLDIVEVENGRLISRKLIKTSTISDEKKEFLEIAAEAMYLDYEAFGELHGMSGVELSKEIIDNSTFVITILIDPKEVCWDEIAELTSETATELFKEWVRLNISLDLTREEFERDGKICEDW